MSRPVDRSRRRPRRRPRWSGASPFGDRGGLALAALGLLVCHGCQTPESPLIAQRTATLYGEQRPWYESVDLADAPPTLGPAAAELSATPTLDDYLTHGLLHHAGLRAAFHRWRAAIEAVPQVSALPEPRLTYGRFVEQVQTRTGPQRNRLGLSQTLPWWGKRSLRADVAGKRAEALWWRMQGVRLQVQRAIKRAYFEFAHLARERRLLERDLALVRGLERIVAGRVAVGAPQSDLLRLQVEIRRLEDRQQSLEQLVPAVRGQLAAAMHRPTGQPLPVPELTEPSVGHEPAEDLLRFCWQHNPQLRALRLQVEASEVGRELAAREPWPDVTLGLDYLDTGGAVNPATRGSGDDPLALSVSFALPIWRGKYAAARREALARNEAAVDDLFEARAQLAADLEMAVYRRTDAARRIGLYRDSLVPRARQALEVTDTSYRAGTVSVSELIDTEQTLLAFEQSYWRACADYEQSAADLEALCGGEIP
ncbi:MAG: TolC family protein [Planctomycetota bacterium]